MPNITAKVNTSCGNDKCGTFARAHLHPHHGGKPMPGSGGKVSGRSSGARNQVAKGHRSNPHMHGGMAIPMKGSMAGNKSYPASAPIPMGGAAPMDSDGDNDGGY